MSDGRDMNDDSGLAFDHAGKESTVQANGGEQVDLQYSLPVLVGEHLESAWSCFCSTDIVHQYVEPTPLLLNAIDYVLGAAGRSEIRLYKESRSQAWSRRRARGGGDRGTAQFKTTYDRFSYTLRATGHENTLAFELIAKNDKRIAVGHILPKKIVIREMFEPYYSKPVGPHALFPRTGAYFLYNAQIWRQSPRTGEDPHRIRLSLLGVVAITKFNPL